LDIGFHLLAERVAGTTGIVIHYDNVNVRLQLLFEFEAIQTLQQSLEALRPAKRNDANADLHRISTVGAMKDGVAISPAPPAAYVRAALQKSLAGLERTQDTYNAQNRGILGIVLSVRLKKIRNVR